MVVRLVCEFIIFFITKMLKRRKISTRTEPENSSYYNSDCLSHCKRLTSATPFPDSLAEKSLINSEIPSFTIRKAICQQFKAKSHSLRVERNPFYQRTFHESSCSLLEDSDSNYDFERQQLINSFFKGNIVDLQPLHNETESFHTSIKANPKIIEHNSIKKSNPCGRYIAKQFSHSKHLLPQTQAQRQKKLPFVSARLKVSGMQAVPSANDKFIKLVLSHEKLKH